MGQIIKVQFANGDSHMAVKESAQQLYHREYDYYHLGEDIQAKKGQYAVVEVGGVMKIVKIVGVGKYSTKATKYAITVFDLDGHSERVEKEQQIASLREEIFARAEEARKMQEMKTLAQSDEVLAKMLADLAELQNKG